MGINLRIHLDLHQLVVREVVRQDDGLEELPLGVRGVAQASRTDSRAPAAKKTATATENSRSLFQALCPKRNPLTA